MIGTQSLQAWFDRAEPFEDYLRGVDKNRDLWNGVHERVRLADELVSSLQMERPVYLLALSEDWCGDAVNTLPVIARMADRFGIPLRVLPRDENLELMDQYLTDGRSRSIPVVIVLNEHFEEVGWWGPRPDDLQRWVLGPGMQMPSSDRYKEARRWYARDKGRTALEEIVPLIRRAAS
jgi:hypothetical protein